MKKSILFIAFTILILTEAFSQSCLPQGITFTTQEQIDNFQTNYPGCTVIEGYVSIEGDNITNLNGLNVLTACNGEFNIEFCDYLPSLSGLENINSLGALNIVFNSALTDLSGLQGLTNISPGHLFIYANISLNTLSGLDNLSLIEGGIEITDNHALINIFGLESMSFTKGINIDCNFSMTDLQGLENLISVEDDFLLYGNNALVDLTGLGSLSTVGGELSIKNNSSLISLSGLSNLDSASHLFVTGNTNLATCNIGTICDFLSNPTGSVNIYDNATGCNNPTEIALECGITLPCLPYGNYYFFSQNDIDNFQNNYPNCMDIMGNVKISGQDINNLAGLSTFNSVSGDLFILINSSLYDLNGFESLSSIGRHLIIEWNESLSNITALNNLTFIGNDLQIWGNNLSTLNGLNNVSHIGNQLVIVGAEVTSLSPLSNLSYLGGTLKLANNDYLTDLSGLENISSIGGNLEIQKNDSLVNLTGLESIATIGGSLLIGVMPYGGNQSLINLSGLDSVTYIGGTLSIYDNDSLESLTSLSNLTSLNGWFQIIDNYNITSLEGIGNINYESISDLYIHGNHSLSYCEVQSVCDYLAAPNGWLSIYDNASGCNTQEEVEYACTVLVSTINIEPEIEIYPNPANNLLYISNTNALIINETTIYNQLGQKVLLRKGITNKIDISTIEQGMYIIELVTNKSKYRQKLIIK